MTDTPSPDRPAPRWVHAWAVLTAAATLVLLVLGQLVTTFRAGMADPVWPTEPWYLVDNYRLDFGYLIEHAHRIAGWVIGVLAAVLAVAVWRTEPRPAARWAGLAAVVVLLLAYGKFHGDMRAQIHAARPTLPVPSAAGMAIALGTAVALGAGGLAAGVRGSGLRLVGLAALVAVMIQGLLGGMRVRLNAWVGTDLAAVHGVFAQVVFALLVSVAVVSARRPTPDADTALAARRLRGWAVGLVALLFVQLVWGAMVRHAPTSVSQRLHILTAFLVVAAVVGHLRALRTPGGRAAAGVGGRLLPWLVAFQVMLGVEAWMGKFMSGGLPELETVTVGKAVTRTLHVLVGTGVLAAAVAAAVRAHLTATRVGAAVRDADRPTKVGWGKHGAVPAAGLQLGEPTT